MSFTRRLKNPGKEAERLAYCETQLANPALDPARRQALTTIAEGQRRKLDGAQRCRRCGRQLEKKSSIERKIGDECLRQEHAS